MDYDYDYSIHQIIIFSIFCKSHFECKLSLGNQSVLRVVLFLEEQRGEYIKT